MNQTPEIPGDDKVASLHPERVPAGKRRIAAEDLERIVRRAAEMQQRAGEPGQQALTEDDVMQIGRQVGLEPEYVRRALAEAHAESLLPAPAADTKFFTTLAGEARLPVRRVVPGEPADIQRRLETALENEENLKPIRRRPGRSIWEPSSHLFDKLQRGLSLDGRSYKLAEAAQVDLGVAELEPGWILVTATADLSNERKEALSGASVGVGVPTVIATAVTFGNAGESVLLALGAGILAFTALAAVAIPWMRWHMTQKRDRYTLALESLLDRVDRD